MQLSISVKDEGVIEGLNGPFGYAMVMPRSYPEMERLEVLICSYNFSSHILHLCKSGFTFCECQRC